MIAIYARKIVLSKRTKLSFVSVSIGRSALFNIFVFLSFLLQFLNDMLILEFHLGFAFCLFSIEQPNRRSVHRATHRFILFNNRRLVNLLYEFRRNKRIFSSNIVPSF